MTEKASTPPVSSGWLRRRLNDIALAAGIVVALLGGMHLIIQLAVTPIHTSLQRIDARLDRMDTRLDRIEGELNELRRDLAAVSERLARVETKLEHR